MLGCSSRSSAIFLVIKIISHTTLNLIGRLQISRQVPLSRISRLSKCPFEGDEVSTYPNLKDLPTILRQVLTTKENFITEISSRIYLDPNRFCRENAAFISQNCLVRGKYFKSIALTRYKQVYLSYGRHETKLA